MRKGCRYYKPVALNFGGNMSYETLIQNRSVRKQILLTEEDNETLKKVSELTGYSQNEIINKGLSAYLKRFTKKLQSVK